MTTSSDLAREGRQMILDFLNRKPGSTCKQIAQAIKASPPQVAARITHMRRQKEVSSEGDGHGDNVVFSALVKTTLPKYPAAGTEVMRQGRTYTTGKPKTRGTVNRCDDSKLPIQRQGGQGSGFTPRTGIALEVMG